MVRAVIGAMALAALLAGGAFAQVISRPDIVVVPPPPPPPVVDTDTRPIVPACTDQDRLAGRC